MPASATAILPEQGQLVDLRQRRFVVADIADSSLPEDPLHPESRVRHHLSCLVFNHGLSRAFLLGGRAPWADVSIDTRIVVFDNGCNSDLFQTG